jgi:TetR/AcrR family transcriptional repressor of nem operon
MKRSKDDAARTRQQIVQAASRLFRAKGIASVSVADVMAECGLTVGGFYRHFENKEALAAEAIEAASLASQGAERDAEQVIKDYVSLGHVQHPEHGCPVAALGSEIHREHGVPREAFDVALGRMLGRISAPRTEQLQLAATAVGAVVLARATDDAKLAKEILEAAQKDLLSRVAAASSRKKKARRS